MNKKNYIAPQTEGIQLDDLMQSAGPTFGINPISAQIVDGN